MARFATAAEGAATLAQRCDQARQTSTGWQACCPAHEDRSPSLSITPTDDRVLLYCHAGCATVAIVAALGLAMCDLFAGDDPRGLPPARRARAQRPHAPAPAPPPAGPPRVTATYDYDAAQGAVLYQVLRWEPGRHGAKKSFTQRRPDPAHPGAWLDNMQGVTRVLYHLPEVLRAVAAGETIYLPEGEKDTNNVRALGLTATTNAGGAGKWAPQYTATLRGAHVVLLPDHDASGRRHTAVVTQALHGVAASLKLVELPGLLPKGDVSDWLQAGGTRAQLEALVAQTPLWEPALAARDGQAPDEANTPGPPLDPRPVVRIGPDITRMVDAGQAALLALPDGPVLFQRARRLALIARGVTPPRWLRRAPDAPTMVEASAAYLDELATQAARWEKYDPRRKRWVEVTPPARFVKTLQGRPAWPFPPLEGIIHSPTLRPDGSVLEQPGYDGETGLYFDANRTSFPALNPCPGLDAARTAIGHLQEVVRDFPFEAPWHCAAWLSGVLSVVCRPTILGCVPLHGITATTRGTGKSLLADTIAVLGTGHPAARWSQVLDEDEERKRLLALALDGDPLVCIDNVTAPLGSSPLALALTASSIKDRLLGATQTKEAPMSAVFLCTGNNVQYLGDVARRVVPIALDPKLERPEERTGFQHSPLLPWLQRERPRLTIAALTIVQAFFVAGCPAQGLAPLGSFEAWSDLIRHALVWAGEADPCEGRKAIEATSNPECEDLAVLLSAWEQCYGTREVTLRHVVEDTTTHRQHVGPDTTRNTWNDLYDALGSCDKHHDGKRLDTRRIGTALRGWQGRVIDGKRLVSPGKDRKNKSLWKIDLL